MKRLLMALIASAVSACAGTVYLDSVSPDGAEPGRSPDGADGGEENPRRPLVGPFALQDVSILFPLPRTAEERQSGLLNASSPAVGGVLFPAQMFERVYPVRSFGADISYDALRVVSLRLDPCAGTTAPDLTGNGCAAELRAVFQPVDRTPIEKGSTLQYGVGDAAVHVFYRITRDQAFELVDRIARLRRSQDPVWIDAPLGIHPVMQAQGLSGRFAQEINQAVANVVGEVNIYRVATMSLDGSSSWSFRDFRVAPDRALAAESIPTLPTNTKLQVLQTLGTQQPFGSFEPEPISGDVYTQLADTRIAKNLSEEERRSQFDALLRIENPRANTVQQVSCAGCHFAQNTKSFIARPLFGLRDEDSEYRFQTSASGVPAAVQQPLFNEKAEDFNQHAFSYRLLEPAVVQRTVNESLAILEYFRTATP